MHTNDKRCGIATPLVVEIHASDLKLRKAM